MLIPSRWLASLLLCLALNFIASTAQAENRAVARCGKGWLEEVDGLMVLHVEGTPYEMGFQHGVLLKEHVRDNLNFMMDEKAKELEFEVAGVKLGPKLLMGAIVEMQRKHIPAWYIEELNGLADGAGLPRKKVTQANFIPEMFHCSGFAVMNSATKDGTLYHGRVLDYAVDWKLQEHAVVIVAKPDQGQAFVNVSFAGFAGCVTGMNAAHISLGEMGGGGLGHWNGVPMAVLMRWALRDATSLDEALAVFRDHPRTCQYYYVAADGKANKAAGFEASWNKFQVIEVGQSHPLLPRPVKDSVLLSAGSRYNCLVDRVTEQHGRLDAPRALRLMDSGVATRGNLHNALFAPGPLKFWVSYASADKTPASDRPYQAFDLTELLQRKPAATIPELPGPSTPAE